MTFPAYQDPNTFIALRRCGLGISSADLGARVGYPDTIASSTIRLIESGRAKIPFEKCREFAAALQVDEAWFALCLLRQRYPEAADAIEKGIAQHRSAS